MHVGRLVALVFGFGMVGLVGCSNPGGIGVGSITGRVVDENGQPIANAVVQLSALQVTTDANGEFVLGGVAAGAWQVVVQVGGTARPGIPVQVVGGEILALGDVPPLGLALQATPATLGFGGGPVTVTVGTFSPLGVPGTVEAWVSGADGETAIPLTAAGAGLWQGTVTVPPNTSSVSRTVTIRAQGTWSETVLDQTATVTVEGIDVPGENLEPAVPDIR